MKPTTNTAPVAGKNTAPVQAKPSAANGNNTPLTDAQQIAANKAAAAQVTGKKAKKSKVAKLIASYVRAQKALLKVQKMTKNAALPAIKTGGPIEVAAKEVLAKTLDNILALAEMTSKLPADFDFGKASKEKGERVALKAGDTVYIAKNKVEDFKGSLKVEDGLKVISTSGATVVVDVPAAKPGEPALRAVVMRSVLRSGVRPAEKAPAAKA